MRSIPPWTESHPIKRYTYLGPYISIGAYEIIWYFPRHHLLEGEGAEASCFLLCIMSGSKWGFLWVMIITTTAKKGKHSTMSSTSTNYWQAHKMVYLSLKLLLYMCKHHKARWSIVGNN
jgi:hypothetical protein